MIPKLTIAPMLQKHMWEIFKWRYDDVYAFYNHADLDESIGEAEALLENSIVVYDGNNNLVGYFIFGAGGQIPTVENYEYNADYLDIGLGLRPDMCGKGLGADFVTLGVEFARKTYGMDKFRMSVATFNERAIKVYEKVGFKKVYEVIHSHFGNKFYIMRKE